MSAENASTPAKRVLLHQRVLRNRLWRRSGGLQAARSRTHHVLRFRVAEPSPGQVVQEIRL